MTSWPQVWEFSPDTFDDLGRIRLHDDFDDAAIEGNGDSIREMLERFGLDFCGGVSRGMRALEGAAGKGHVEVMQILTDAGVKDTGSCLVFALQCRQRISARFLMKQYQRDSLDHVEKCSGATLLNEAIVSHTVSGVKMVRWLMNARASTKKRVVIKQYNPGAVEHVVMGTCRETLDREIQRHLPGKVPPTLTAIDRLLEQEEAVHANSWLWPETDVEEKIKKKKKSGSVFKCMCARVVVGGLLRYAQKMPKNNI